MSTQIVPPRLTREQQLMVTRSRERVEAIVASAWKRFPRRELRDDMLQAGLAACAECALKYDPTMGVPFHGYFGKRVYGAAVEAAIVTLYGKRGGKRGTDRLRALRAEADAREDAVEEESSIDLLADPPDPMERIRARARELAGALLSAATREAANGQAEAEERARDDARREILARAIATLPEHEKRVTQQVWFEGRRPEEVALDEKVHARSIRRYEARAMARITAYVNGHASD